MERDPPDNFLSRKLYIAQLGHVRSERPVLLISALFIASNGQRQLRNVTRPY